MRDDRGFTLIELLAVVAILSVFTGILSFNLGSVNGRNVSAAAANLVKAVNLTEATTRADGDTSLTVYNEDGTIKADISSGTKKTTSVISDGKLIVFVSMGDVNDPSFSSEYTRMRSGDRFTYTFDRGTGGVSGDNVYVRNIRFVKGTYVKTVRLYPHTGKAEINGK